MQREGELVGARGFEPPTPASRTRCATELRYAPIIMNRIFTGLRSLPPTHEPHRLLGKSIAPEKH